MKSIIPAALATAIILPAMVQASDAFISQVELRPRVSTSAPSMPQVPSSLTLDVPAVPLAAMTNWHAGLTSLLDGGAVPEGAKIVQQGEENDALIIQSGPNNRGLIHQSGTANAASMTQMGHFNLAAITQSGSGLRGAILQIGVENRAMIVQSE